MSGAPARARLAQHRDDDSGDPDARGAATVIRVGVIGAGTIGAWHARILAKGAKGLAAICARRRFGPAEVARFARQSSTLRVLGIHDFDLVRWLHPVPVAAVQAVGVRGAIHAAHGLHDHVVTFIAFADGVIASVESGWTLPAGYQACTTPSGGGRRATTGSQCSVWQDSCPTTCRCAASR